MAKNGSIFLNFLNFPPKKTEGIISFLGDTEKIFDAKESDLANIAVLTDTDRQTIIKSRDSDAFKQELRLIAREQLTVIDIHDKDYPESLKEIAHPPLVLYIRGKAQILSGFLLGIVGTRIPTIYGLSMAQEFSHTLSSLGFVVVSGLARGIDTAAHKAAIENGKTIAVLGSGLLNIYPKENSRLAGEIARQGAVISEFPLTTPPLKENFPRRNRIISGLSRGILVVEAAQKSGALITAHLALEQNREVFALPGKVDSPLSRGTHLLIKEGAKLVDSVGDILAELNIDLSRKQQKFSCNISSQEKVIFDIITNEGISLEEIILKCNLERPLLNTLVLSLQLKGLIREVRPACFARLRGMDYAQY
ncbi:MAG: DNA-processing protein DprA [Candidatus Omnitrophica bacterium]|nr:DNA-processing protein DprA [Candidatus Omnitrophota bacterium]